MKKFKDIFKQKVENVKEIKKVNIINEANTDPEDILIKNNIKIKKKYGTKFGTEFELAKTYDKDKLNKILKSFDIMIDGNSVFVKF